VPYVQIWSRSFHACFFSGKDFHPAESEQTIFRAQLHAAAAPATGTAAGLGQAEFVWKTQPQQQQQHEQITRITG